MPLILTSRTPWRRRPSGLVEIDRSSPQANGLAVLYPLRPDAGIRNAISGASGTTVGTLTYGAGLDGLVWRGDGSSRAIATGVSLSATDLTACTWSAWINTALVGSRQEVLSTEGGDASGGSLNLKAAGTIEFGIFTGGSNYPVASGGSITAGVPSLITGVRTGTSGSLIVYINGQQVASATASASAPSVTTAQPAQIGRYYTGANWFNGDLWDVRVYTRALSAAEVWQLYAPDTRWSLYAPIVRRAYFDLGGAGGTTYNESLSFAAASSLPMTAAATGVAAIGVAATAALSPASAATASAAVSLAAAVAAAMSGAATASSSLSVAASATLAHAAAATAGVASSFAASAAMSPTGAATVPVGVSLSASAAAAMSGAATSVAGVDFSSAAAQTHAVTCLSSVAVALSALSALSMSDGSTQNVSESVSFTATATQQMAATAVADAVQTYLASAGLTHASAATAGAALALSVSAAIGQQATMQASATIILSAAAQLLLSSSASGDISYTVLRIAAETLRHARATSDTLHHAQTTGDTLQ